MKSIVIVATLLAAAPACGPGRTAAATQPSPKAFDASQSDAKSLEVVAAMQQALGSDKWPTVKQLRWTAESKLAADLKSHVEHAWDIWNGRHRCEVVEMATYTKPTAENPHPDEPGTVLAMYDLFDVDSASGYALNDKGQEMSGDDRRNLKKTCFNIWKAESYQLTMFHKLKDPGVMLHYEGQLKDQEVKGVGTVCKGGCDTIKVSFDPAVGTDSWWVHVSTTTHLPEVVESQAKGGRIGFVVSDWTEVAGLKFPQKLQNAGLPDEVLQMSDIQIGEPDGRLYIPEAR
jgi:hypothetical protein